MNVYTTSQIHEAWDSYQKAYCWKYLKPGGRSAMRMTAPDTRAENITQCKMVRVRNVLSFPKYLEVEYGK